MTIKTPLSTGVTVLQRKKGGRISVKCDNYDDRFDSPTPDTLLKEYYKKQLHNILKPIH